MRDLDKFAKALRRLAEGSPNRLASCPLGNGLRIAVSHEDTATGERIYTLSASRYLVAPQPDDLFPISEAFGAPTGSEWNWRRRTHKGGLLHTAECSWLERRCSCADEQQAA